MPIIFKTVKTTQTRLVFQFVSLKKGVSGQVSCIYTGLTLLIQLHQHPRVEQFSFNCATLANTCRQL